MMQRAIRVVEEFRGRFENGADRFRVDEWKNYVRELIPRFKEIGMPGMVMQQLQMALEAPEG